MRLRFIAQLALSAALVFAGFYYMQVIVPERESQTGHAFLHDLYPTWYAVHAVLAGRDPYSAHSTRQIQEAMYGGYAAVEQSNQQRFAYPLFAVLPAIVLGLVSFQIAQQLCFWGGIALAMATAWLRCMWVECKFNLLLCAAILAAPPVTLAIVLRQPTLLYLFLLALTAYLFRQERYWLAGIAAALASAKPQLAMFVLLPLAIVTFADWKSRKTFIFSYSSTLIALLSFSFVMQPDWFVQWLMAVKAYQRYGSIFEFYNAPLVIPIYLWLWKNRRDILSGPFYRQLFILIPSAVLIGGYASVVVSCFFGVLIPWVIFFFHRAALFLAIEAPFVLYAMKTKLRPPLSAPVDTENALSEV